MGTTIARNSADRVRRYIEKEGLCMTPKVFKDFVCHCLNDIKELEDAVLSAEQVEEKIA